MFAVTTILVCVKIHVHTDTRVISLLAKVTKSGINVWKHNSWMHGYPEEKLVYGSLRLLPPPKEGKKKGGSSFF
uniref:Uncharacterized protein n=1 Tax=Rhizophora mucronata TaxID=61149 RepID=A0A2P2IS00_RHIMU